MRIVLSACASMNAAFFVDIIDIYTFSEQRWYYHAALINSSEELQLHLPNYIAYYAIIILLRIRYGDFSAIYYL